MCSSRARGRYVKVTWVSPMDPTRYPPSSVSPSLIGNTMSPLARSTDCRPPCTSFPAYLYGIGGAVGAGGTWGAVEILGAGGCHEREEKSCVRNSPSRERSGNARGTEPLPPAACDELSVLAVRGERSTLPESKTTSPSVPARTASRTVFLIRARMSLKHFIEPAAGHERCDYASSLVRLGQGGCSRAATSDRRVATIKSGFRDSGSRLEPLLWGRVDVFPSFLPNRHLPRPAVRPGFFFVWRSRCSRIRAEQSR